MGSAPGGALRPADRDQARVTIATRTPMTRIGVISDTHGLLRPEAIAALRGSDRILHAGDVGRPAVLDGLRRVAPVTVAILTVTGGESRAELVTLDV